MEVRRDYHVGVCRQRQRYLPRYILAAFDLTGGLQMNIIYYMLYID